MLTAFTETVKTYNAQSCKKWPTIAQHIATFCSSISRGPNPTYHNSPKLFSSTKTSLHTSCHRWHIYTYDLTLGRLCSMSDMRKRSPPVQFSICIDMQGASSIDSMAWSWLSCCCRLAMNHCVPNGSSFVRTALAEANSSLSDPHTCTMVNNWSYRQISF